MATLGFQIENSVFKFNWFSNVVCELKRSKIETIFPIGIKVK